MSLIERTGQLWRTRTDFRLMYNPTGINRVKRYAYYVVLSSKTTKWDNHDVTHHTIALTKLSGVVVICTILEDKKKLEERFVFMGAPIE